MRFEFGLIESVEHKQEVFDVVKVLRRLIIRLADSMSVGVGSDGWNNTQKSVELLVPVVEILVERFSSQCGISIWL